MKYSYYESSYKEAIERLNKPEEHSEYYKYGIENKDVEDGYNCFKDKYGEPVGGSKEWRDFLDGQADPNYIIGYQKYQEYKIEEFIIKMRELAKEYEVDLDFGCGCCSFGHHCKDLEFSITGKDLVWSREAC